LSPITLEFLPAREGDAIWIDAGPTRIQIDGGRIATCRDLRTRIEAMIEEGKALDLLVVTHVDRDHIEGVLEMLKAGKCPEIRDVWFNGYVHLLDEAIESYSPQQGEALSRLIRTRQLPWNHAFGGKRIAVVDGDPLPSRTVGEITLTLLSPTPGKLEDLRGPWKKACEDAGLIPGVPATAEPLPPEIESFGPIDIEELADKPFEADHAEPNGSSIAFLLEHDGKRVLLSGDAHPEILIASIDRILEESGEDKLAIDLFKLPHHGSRKNVSKDLLEKLDCPRYVFSTNGSYFDHPDPVAVARVLKFGGADKTLYFNYHSPESLIWDKPDWKTRYNYSTVYPAADENGFLIIEVR